MPENAMSARGRPAKVLTPNDIQALEKFLEQLPYQKKNQQQALTLLQQSTAQFTEQQLKLLKTVDREKSQFQQRHALIEQIQIKHKNQQKLLANEIEILGLLEQEQDRNTFFRLDRALESYQKIEKAALENRIRLENEQKREILRKTNTELTESQQKRNNENQLKYALGGAVLSIWKKFQWNLDPNDLENIKNKIEASLIFESKMRNSSLYKEALAVTQDRREARKLFFLALDKLPTYNINQEEFHKALLKTVYKSQ